MACKYMTLLPRGDSEAYYCKIDGRHCGHPHDDACLKPEWFEPLKKEVNRLEKEFGKKVKITRKGKSNEQMFML